MDIDFYIGKKKFNQDSKKSKELVSPGLEPGTFSESRDS